MPKMKSKPSRTEKPKKRPEPATKRRDAIELKPAESAENFEHVLRRLVIARDRLKANGN